MIRVRRSGAGAGRVRDLRRNYSVPRLARIFRCSLMALAVSSAPSVAGDVPGPLAAVPALVVAEVQPSLQALVWVYRQGRSGSDVLADDNRRRQWRSRRSFAEPYWRDPGGARGNWWRYDRYDRFPADGLARRRVAPAYGQPSDIDDRQRWQDRDRWRERRDVSRDWRYEGGWWWPPETRTGRR